MIVKITYKIASSDIEFKQGKELFIRYAESLNLDLCFQDFATELNIIQKLYNVPHGSLIIAYSDKNPVGCVAIRNNEKDIAELKRMFILPEHRGKKTGRKLLEIALDKAKQLGYKKVRLDTLSSMTRARQLYHSFGFYEIAPYCFNPIVDAVFMEKDLLSIC